VVEKVINSVPDGLDQDAAAKYIDKIFEAKVRDIFMTGEKLEVSGKKDLSLVCKFFKKYIISEDEYLICRIRLF